MPLTHPAPSHARTRQRTTAGLVALLVAGLAGCAQLDSWVDQVNPAAAAGGAEPDGTGTAASGTAIAALETLEVKGRAPRTGYDRDEFGPSWADVDRNGCDTRITYSA